MATTFRSNRPAFNHKNAILIDMIQGHMAMDVERSLKNDAGMPVDTGNMKSQTRHFKTDKAKLGGYRVEIDVEYAGYQEAGMRADGSHAVENYTTGGTSAGFFKRAVDSVVKNQVQYIREARRAIGL